MRIFFKHRLFTFFILLVFVLPVTLQTFHPGFFVGDDGEWMIIRSSAFHEALRDGQFPVRLLGRLNNEYGYPVSTFLYPGYLYLTEPFILLHLGFILSIKIMFMLTMVLSAIFAYFWFAKTFSKWASFLGAVIYVYLPYHLVDMYQRGSLGELLALCVIPFIFWQIERKSLKLTGAGLGMLFLSHNILAALFLPCVLIYSFLRQKGSSMVKITSTGKILGIGLALAAFFWIPALFELPNTVFNQTTVALWQHYFAIYQQIGLLVILFLAVALLVLIASYSFKKKNPLLLIKKEKTSLIFFTSIGLVGLFFSTPISSVAWVILPVKFIQFPFRFLSLEIFAISFLGAYFFDALKKHVLKVCFLVGTILVLTLSTTAFFLNIQSFDKGEGFYATNESTTTTSDEYMPIWVKEKPLARPEEPITVMNDTKVSDITVNNKRISFTIEAKNKTIAQINKIYWPGWRAKIDGKNAAITYTNKEGLMNIIVPSGKHTIILLFKETPLRFIADAITLLGFLFLLLPQTLYKKKS